MSQRDTQAAQHSITQALTLNPEHPGALVQRAQTMTSDCRLNREMACLEAWQDAAALLRQALEIDPSHMGGIYNLGIVELYTGRPGRAVNYLRIAHGRAPWSPRLNFHLGECLRLLGNPRAVNYLINARDWTQLELFRDLAEQSLALMEG